MMKKEIVRSLATMLLFGVCGSSAVAQVKNRKADEDLSREMTIEKEFDPIFRDASKVNILPTVDAPQVEKAAIEYSKFVVPVTPRAQVPVLGALEPNSKYGNERGFVRLGLGNYWNTVGQFDFSAVSTEKDQLHFGFNHISTSGKVKLLENDIKRKMNHNEENAAMLYKHQFKKLELNTQLSYMNKGFNFYGYGFNDQFDETQAIRSQMHHNFDFRMGIVSHKKEGFNYAFDASYNYWGNKNSFEPNLLVTKQKGVQENNIRFNAHVLSIRPNNNIIGMKLGLSNYFYNRVTTAELTPYTYKNRDEDFNNYALVTASPYYKIIKENFDLHLGLNAIYSINKGKAITFTPDVYMQAAFIEQFGLYAFIKGGVNENSLANVSRENMYVSPSVRIQDSRTFINSEFGLKINPVGGLFIQPLVGLKFVENEHFFVNNLYESTTGAEFHPYYSDMTQFRLGGTLRYQYRKYVDFNVTAVYNNYTVDNKVVTSGDFNAIEMNVKGYAWQKPTTEVDIKLSSQIIPSLKLTAGYYLGMGRKGLSMSNYQPEVFTMADIHDVSLGATYHIIKGLSGWLQVNNILNKRYELYQGYAAQGINFMLGASYVF